MPKSKLPRHRERPHAPLLPWTLEFAGNLTTSRLVLELSPSPHSDYTTKLSTTLYNPRVPPYSTRSSRLRQPLPDCAQPQNSPAASHVGSPTFLAPWSQTMAPKRGASREPPTDPAQPQRSSRRLRGNSEDPNLSPLSKGLEPVRRKTTRSTSASTDQPTTEPTVARELEAEVQAGSIVDQNDQQNQVTTPATVSLVHPRVTTCALG